MTHDVAEGSATYKRCVAMPVQGACVASPAIGNDITNADLWRMLGRWWDESTDLANWCVQRCARHDVVRTRAMARLPKMPAWPESGPSEFSARKHKGLYGCAIHELGTGRAGDFWAGCMSEVAYITKTVEEKWKARRYGVLWLRNEAPVLFRYPYPYPVSSKNWRPLMIDGRCVAEFTAPGGAGKVALFLRGGPEFGRQVASFRKAAEAEARGEPTHSFLTLTRQRASNGCHRPTMAEREPGGGQRTQYRIMARMTVTEQARERPSDRVMTVCTDPEALLVAELDGRRAWVLNADHVRRAVEWQASHEAKRQRWAQDCKAERRADSRKLRQFEESRERCCIKHARRMNSWIQETASHLARFAVRQRVGEVAYMDDNKTYMPSFPWHRLRETIRFRLVQEGIDLITRDDASGEAMDETVAASRVEQVQ